MRPGMHVAYHTYLYDILVDVALDELMEDKKSDEKDLQRFHINPIIFFAHFLPIILK